MNNTLLEKMNDQPALLVKIIFILSVILFLTSTDLIVKEVANKNLKGKPAGVSVIKNFWYFQYAENDDIGFSLLRNFTNNMNKHSKYVFLVLLQGLGTIFVIGFYFYTKHWKYLIPLSLISAGALGNVIDRIFRGYVVDYVNWYFHFIPLRLFNPWPTFNLADVYTVIGAILLFVVIFLFEENSKESATQDKIQDEK